MARRRLDHAKRKAAKSKRRIKKGNAGAWKKLRPVFWPETTRRSGRCLGWSVWRCNPAESQRTNHWGASLTPRPFLFLLVACTLTNASCKDAAHPSGKLLPSSNDIAMWPPLPTKGFIKGRPATDENIAQGNAAFMLPNNGGRNPSQAMNIEIPQYCYHTDSSSGKRTRGILIQAERASDGKELAAMQTIGDGGHVVGLLKEFTLLGKTPPAKE